MIKTSLTLFFCVTLSSQLFSQNTLIDSLVNEIDQYNRLDLAQTSYIGYRSRQYERYLKLSETATTEELLSLLKHKNTVVQGYASWALIQQRYDGLDSVFSYFGQTGLTVKTISGCIVSRESLLHQMYDKLNRELRFYSKSAVDSLFLQEQQSKLDSLVLFDRIKGKREFPPDYYMSWERDSTETIPDFPVVDKYLLSKILRNNEAQPKRYEVIRKWAFEQENEDALIPLALYQRNADIESFKALGDRAFTIIPYFQAPALREFLVSQGPENYGSDYFGALASFKDQTALDSLSAIYLRLHKEKSTRLIHDIAYAINEYYTPLYSTLSLQITTDYGVLPSKLAALFLKERPEQLAMAAHASLKRGDDKFLALSTLSLDYSYLMPEVLELVNTYYPESMVDICVDFIKKTDFTQMELYTDFVRKHRLESTTKVMLKKLKQKNRAFEIFHLTQTILFFENTRTHKKLKNYLKASRKEWDSGNWTKTFAKLFDKYDFQLN